MFKLFKSTKDKRFNEKYGLFLEKEYWTKEKIGTIPKFPLVEIDFSDGGTKDSYIGMREIEGRWNHFIFEDYINEEYPTYLIDPTGNLYILQFHLEQFNYPKLIGRKNKNELIEIIRKCNLSNISVFENTSTFDDLFTRLLNIDFKY